MISYELAIKLKDAGFPYNYDGIEILHYPTLSELIEACGDEFGRLERVDFDSQIRFVALRKGVNTIAMSIGYVSPSEAVANLWIALNKKVINS